MLTSPMEAAFFDLDKTVIAKSSVLAFGRPLYREGLLSRSALLKSAYNQAIYRLRGADEARMERARDTMLSVTRGWEQAQVSGIVRETFEKIVAPIIYAEALELFEDHLDAGRKIFLVSSSPIEIVSHLADYLGIDECIASRSRVDADGRYTGELEFYAYGPHKAAAIRDAADRDGIDLARSYAYSDSITDAPMLEIVGHPVAVNPDRELARLARQKDWEIREFDQPVRLRRRVPTPAPAPTAAVGGVLAALGLGVAGYRWAQRERVPLRHRLSGGTEFRFRRDFAQGLRRIAIRRRLWEADAGVPRSNSCRGPARGTHPRSRLHREGDGRPHRVDPGRPVHRPTVGALLAHRGNAGAVRRLPDGWWVRRPSSSWRRRRRGRARSRSA